MHPDVLIIGAGVFGLSAAFAAHRAGLTVRVLEAARPGAGASGGVVGALTAHAPTRWRPMMAFQFAALQALPARAADLTDLTGLDCGYRRVGRIAPLADERALDRARAEVAAAPDVWGDAGPMRVVERPDFLSPDLTAFGAVFDDISARISPRGYLAALAAALPPATIDQARVNAILPGPAARTDRGNVPAGAIVCAAGWQGWSLLPEPLRGTGVKGQAALLKGGPDGLPVITHDGMYIVPHGNGTIAVGSTSERSWESEGTDGALDTLIDRAIAMVPALSRATVTERWSGIRPRPPGRDPVAGPVPGLDRVWVAGGGYKIGFGIAHAVGDAVIAGIAGAEATLPVPESFLPATHI